MTRRASPGDEGMPNHLGEFDTVLGLFAKQSRDEVGAVWWEVGGQFVVAGEYTI